MLVALCLILSGCYYSDGCFHTPQMVNCIYYATGRYPDITMYHKKGHITDKNTRWKDAISCGAIYDEYGWIYKNLKRESGSDMRNTNGIRKFALCMTNKGYEIISEYDCWKKGICN